MCGIAGQLGSLDPGVLNRMLDAMGHRGPDGSGVHGSRNRIGVTRLAIVDPSAAADPLTNESRSLALAFNGEIYNHRELRRELEQRGHTFATRTDSEVVVHLYEEEGARCVNRLRGMFAFAILTETELFLARDRLGIKPLYYAGDLRSGQFTFASEIRALLTAGVVKAELDMQAFADFLVLGHPVSTRTHFTGISELAPGHTLTVRCGEDALATEGPDRYFDRRAAR